MKTPYERPVIWQLGTFAELTQQATGKVGCPHDNSQFLENFSKTGCD